MSNEKKYKLAIIAPVPFYYHIQLYQKLSRCPEVSLMVYYCSDETLRNVDVEKTYKSKGSFVNKQDLLDGYTHTFLRNYAPRPSYLRWPFGLVNFGIWKEIKKGNYDAVVLQSWTNLTWWLAFLACLLYKTPIIFMTDSNVLSESSKPSWKKYLKKKILGGFLFNKANGFLTSGRANEAFYQYYNVPLKKMVRLYFSWGYENLLEKAKELKPRRDAIRESLSLKPEDFLVVYIGRLAKEKNPGILLRAFAKLPQANKKLFFVGDGPLRGEIETAIKELGLHNVIIKGFIPRSMISDFYAAADALVLPSNAETWGIVISEAMCFGLPIIASSAVGAAVDLVESGRNGFIFKSGNVDNLVHYLDQLINLSPVEHAEFGQRSKEMIELWLNNIDGGSQIVKMLESLKQ